MTVHHGACSSWVNVARWRRLRGVHPAQATVWGSSRPRGVDFRANVRVLDSFLTSALADAKLSRKEASECEAIAGMPIRDRREYAPPRRSH